MRELQNVTIETSTKCNFHCGHCCNDSGISECYALMKEQVFDIIDQMQAMKVKRMGLTGGEPFCDENLFDYIKYAKDKIPVISIATNGYLVDEKIIERLLKYNVTKLAVSLDGTEAYHDTFRGKIGAYQHALRAIKLMVEAGMEVKIKTVLTKNNREEILKLMDVTNGLNVKRHEMFPVCPIGRAEDNLILDREEYKEFLIKAIEKIKSYGKPGTTFQLKPVFSQEKLFVGADSKCSDKSLMYRCDALDTSLEIGSDGDVYGCSFVRIPIGNIKCNSLYEIWNSRRAEGLHYKIMNHNKFGECGECVDNDKCNGGCYAHKLYSDGEENKDIYCFVKRRR